MIKVRHEITLPNPIEEVFDFIANPENNPKWDSHFLNATLISQGPIGVGTTGKSIGMFLGKTYDSTIECAEFSPPHNVAHHLSIGPAQVETRNGLQKVGNRTKVMHDRRIRLRGLRKLYEPFIGRKIKRKVIADLEQLELYFRLKSSAGF